MNNHLLSRVLVITMIIIASTNEATAATKKEEKPVAPKPSRTASWPWHRRTTPTSAPSMPHNWQSPARPQTLPPSRYTDAWMVIISKSNSNEPEVYVYQHETNYYRWENTDDVFFLGCDFSDYHPWNSYWGPIYLHQMSKEDKDGIKARVDEYKELWKTWHKQNIKDREEAIKKMPNGSADKKAAKKALTDYKEKRPPQVWVDWNKAALAKIKAKSDNYELNNN